MMDFVHINNSTYKCANNIYINSINHQQLLLSLIDDDEEFIDYPVSWQVQALSTKIGLGRGKVKTEM